MKFLDTKNCHPFLCCNMKSSISCYQPFSKYQKMERENSKDNRCFLAYFSASEI